MACRSGQLAPTRTGELKPDWALRLAGIAVSVISLLALGRSFGLVAADRGLVTTCPYAVVWHSTYAHGMAGRLPLGAAGAIK